jgi:NitT/TauT family transport system permease protein
MSGYAKTPFQLRSDQPWGRSRENVRRLLDIGIWAISAIGLLFVWGWSVTRFDVSPAIIPHPYAVWTSLVANTEDGTFVADIAATLQVVLYGFVIGATGGFILAIAISEFRIARIILYPYLIAFQSIPKVALAPIFLIWFGFGNTSKVVLVVAIVFFPLLINTLSGLGRVDPAQLDLLKAYCGRRWRVFLRVKLPTALPLVFAGLELGVVFAMIAAVVAEFQGAIAGLGYRILYFGTNLDMAGQFATLVVLTTISVTLHRLVKIIGDKVVFWGKS